MTNGSRQFYQREILKHNKAPFGYGAMEDYSYKCEGKNPLCGDRYTVYVRMGKGVLDSVSFEGEGCAISKASASLMTKLVHGRPTTYIQSLYQKFEVMLGGNGVEHEDGFEQEMQALSLFEPLSKTRSRVKCATLCWATLLGAMERQEEATTE